VSTRLRAAVVGVGHLGRFHAEKYAANPGVELVAVVDVDESRARTVGEALGVPAYGDHRGLRGRVDCASVAVPTPAHFEVARDLLEAGIDVLVEKPLTTSVEEGKALLELAVRGGRVLQVGHLERFNPAMRALGGRVTEPRFIECQRLAQFGERGTDVDVVLDLMIHDVDVVLALAKDEPQEIRAAGVHILSAKEDIANVRLQFPNGCVANLTASRISTERVRKLRLFQPHQYLSLDYGRQDLAIFSVNDGRQIGFEQAPVTKGEPLKLQLEAFLNSVETRVPPKCSGHSARQSLRVALAILDKIKEHAEVVSRSLATGWTP
jgi:predicted dehydrogenase